MSIWKDKQKGYWRYSFQHMGKSYTGSGYGTRREAESARSVRRDLERSALPVQPKTGMGFYEASRLYLDHAERRFVHDTYTYKATILSRFLAHLGGDVEIKSISPGAVMDFLQTLPSNNAYNVHRKDLSAMFAFIRRNHRQRSGLDVNPCADIERMPHTSKPKALPSEEDILKMIMAADPETDERDLLLCCIHTLGRVDELLRLTWQDVNFESRVVTLWTRKRKGGAYEADPLPMNQDLYDVLKRVWKKRKQEQWVFFNEKAGEKGDRYRHRPRMMGSICKRAGIVPIGHSQRKIGRGKKKGKYKDIDLYYGFHSLRHFMASYLADREKVGTQAISKLLRHKSIRTTEIYLHSVDESQRSAMVSLEGKFTSKKPDAHTEGAHGET